MKQIAVLNFEGVTVEEEHTFIIRNTARAVIFDANNNIALMKVARKNAYKLPGGGIDEGEELIDGLRRECFEETGVEIDIQCEIGYIKEVRKMFGKIQNSYCYLVHVKGEKKQPQFTESEKKDGFELLWVPFDEALRLVTQKGEPTIFGKYVRARESAILNAAKELINLGLKD